MLLCLKSSTYYTLDEVGAIVWDALDRPATCEDVVDAVLRRTTASRPSVSSDVTAFVAGLSAQGLVVDAPEQAVQPVCERLDAGNAEERELALPPTWLCVVMLCAISLALPRIGIDRALRRAWVNTPRYRAAASPDCFRALAQRVASASALCPFRSECLEQSLFILWWMRRQQLLADLCLGAQAYPFKAHAWVESANVPVNEHPDRLAHYRRFERGERRRSCSPR